MALPDRRSALSNKLASAQIPFELSADIRQVQWHKLLSERGVLCHQLSNSRNDTRDRGI
jgi:hypothetical protein